MQPERKISPAVTVIVIGAVANLLMAVLKFIGGILGNSTALVNDAVHSVSDLLTDCVALLTYKISNLPRDDNHPYGHGRAESIGAGIIGLFILMAGLGLAVDSLSLVSVRAGWDLGIEPWEILHTSRGHVPTWIASICALGSILINEALYRYTRIIGEREKSPSLIANAWHHRSDAVSSIAALIGIIGAMAGYPLMDPAAGVIVALMITKVGVEIIWGGIKDLMDTSLEGMELERIRSSIESTPGVIRSHELRTRRLGGEVFMDVHILVDRECSVTEGHQISETVRRRLLKEFEPVEDVLVHVDTEDDMDQEPVYHIDSEELKRLADPVIASTHGVLTRTRLRVHYHKGQVILEVFVRMAKAAESPEVIRSTLQGVKTGLQNLEAVDEARVYLDMNLE